ncbi:MAG TPA: hypothetical protein VK943_16495, partial [Arenibaculum sp.]|nr:hypothetical protein [Arenibaculum sp.]
TPREVRGRPVTGEPLIPPDRFMPMGAVQVARAGPDVPGGLRLRVYAPAGHVYGPTDLSRRDMPRGWEGFTLPEREIVNPAAKWATLKIWENVLPPLASADARNNPAGLAAVDGEGVSLGLIDDVSDGLVSCTIPGLPTACARVAIGPPDFAPDARPIVSLQDGLADRIDRAAARLDTIPTSELEALVHDIFERALETSDLMNKDAQSDRAHRENGEQLLPPPPPGYQDRAHGTLWPRPDAAPAGDPPRPSDVDGLPVSAQGRRKHRRLSAVEYLKDRLREEPGYIDTWLRPPVDASPAYDRRMPPLMRNSDRYPLHLTRRQYDLVKRWAAQLAAERGAVEGGQA